jgi:Fe-S cluster biosynthesis and repair protein YggX
VARNVFCKKYQKELEGLKAPPYPGPKGQQIYDTVSQQAWNAWLERQTMLINEKHLSMANKEARSYLSEQMEKFFNNEEVDQAEGYVAPKS